MNVHNFWRSLEQWKKIIQYGKIYEEFCGLCFEPKCNCGVEKVAYQDALDELSYWADINIMESATRGLGFVQDNQGYDRDHVYPFLPEISRGAVAGIKTQIPQDMTLTAYIVRGSRQWYYDGDTFKITEDINYMPGITWGILMEEFYPIARYDYPLWYVYRSPPPYGVEVTITDNVPNYRMRIVPRE